MSKNTRPKRILITNIVSLNTGDAAILWGMLQILRARYGSDVEVTVFDRSAKAASKYYPWASFRQALFTKKPTGWLFRQINSRGYGHWYQRLRFWLLRLAVKLVSLKAGGVARLFLGGDDLRSIREYVSADLIVSTGGTYLIENYSLWSAIYDYRLSLSSGAPLIFFTQTLGPFRRPEYRRAFTNIFEQASGIFLRDQRSCDHLLQLGIDAQKITLGKDAAFVISAPNRPAPERPLSIAISVRTLKFFNDESRALGASYISAVSAMVNLLVRKYGAEVTFLSTCQGIPEYWTDDSRLAEEIKNGLPDDVKPRVVVDSSFRQPMEIIDAFQQHHLVIATRMHAAILGLVAGTPVLGIAYEFKLEELFSQLGLEQALLSVDSMNESRAEKCLEHVLDHLDALRSKIAVLQEQCRTEAGAVASRLPDV